MLDSPSLRIAVRRTPPIVEDLRSTTVPDDPVQRRDLILLERARGGDLDAFNDLVVVYQDALFALVVRMVPDRDQAGVAERYTRRSQTPLGATPCGFESHLRHHAPSP